MKTALAMIVMFELICQSFGGIKDLKCFQCEYSTLHNDPSCGKESHEPDPQLLKKCPPYSGTNPLDQPVCGIWTFKLNSEATTSIRRQCLYLNIMTFLNGDENHVRWGYIEPPEWYHNIPDVTAGSDTYKAGKMYVCNDAHGCNGYDRGKK